MEMDITSLVDSSMGNLAEVTDLVVQPNVLIIHKLRIERRYEKDDVFHLGNFRVILTIE